jgi:hypothetical protein
MPDFMGEWLQNKSVEIHALARQKGWWDRERENAELIELVHSEISEATEEVRNNRKQIYQNQGSGLLVVTPDEKHWNPAIKPEGVLIEYADAGIRILDILAHREVEINRHWECALSSVVIENYPNELCFHMVLRKHISAGLLVKGIYATPLVETLALFVKYFRLRRFEVDFQTVIETKMAFNRTRPNRHGGKKF